MATRRQLLAGMGQGALCFSGLPRLAMAQAGSEQKLIFITCFGGWDPTRTIVPAFDNPLVSMETLAEAMTIGSLDLVQHPGRPAVTQFFERFGNRTSLVHGILTPSVAHEACLELMRTGSLGGQADWPTILANEVFQNHPIPHLVLTGDVFVGEFGHLVARTGVGGKLESLLSGELDLLSDVAVTGGDAQLRLAEFQMRQRRLQNLQNRTTDSLQNKMVNQYSEVSSRAQTLLDRHHLVDWNSDGSFLGDCLVAAEVLEQGISPCISISHPALWDSHSDNDVFQHWLWEGLFFGIYELCDALNRVSTESGSLLDQTTIVIASDMGRAPRLNSSLGKDHWPYSSAMVISNQLDSRVVGGYDQGFQGWSLDRVFNTNAGSDERLTAAHFGSSLLDLWGVSISDGPSIFS